MFFSSTLYGDGGYGVQVFLQSPKAVQRYPGEVFTLALLVQNISTKEDIFFGKIEAPNGWETIPTILPTYQLDPNENGLEIIGIKIPNGTPPGMYTITYTSQGTSNPSLYGSAQVVIEVLSVEKIEAQLSCRIESVFEGKTYEAECMLTNFGNASRELKLEALSSLDSKITFLPKSFITLKPGEIQNIKLKIKTHKGATKGRRDYIQLRVVDVKTGEEVAYQTLLTKVITYNQQQEDLSKYNRIPSSSTFVAGFQNGHKSIFINTEGSGSLDKENTKLFSYLFQVPIIQHTSIYRQIGGTPEKYYLSYSSTYFDVYAGDGVYQLTPLTMTSRYGRGGNVTIKTSKVETGSLGIVHSSAVPHTDVGVFLRVLPHQTLGIQGSYFYTHGRLGNEKLNRCVEKETANIVSISSDYILKDTIAIQAEYAGSRTDKTHLKGHSFFLQGRGRPHERFWIAFQKLYAPEDFFGYYNNQSQGNAALGVLVSNRINIMGSYQTYSLNISRNPIFLTANTMTRYIAEVTSSTPFGMYISGSYNTYSLRDRLLQDGGYITRFGAIRLSQAYKQFTLQSVAEVGSYSSRFDKALNRTWQNYDVYAYLRHKMQTYALYGKWGYLANLFSIQWNQTYGASLNLNFGSCDFKFSYEQSHSRSRVVKRYYLSNFTYRFKNHHVLDVYGNILKNFSHDNIYRLLVSYKIPWGLPLGRNKDKIRMRGRVYTEERGIIKPQAEAIITCNEYQVKTDKKGRYCFDDLRPGNYLLTLEDFPEGFIPDEFLPKKVEIETKDVSLGDIVLKKPCSIGGEIYYYNFEEESISEEDPILRQLKTERNIGDITHYKQGAGAIVNIKLISKTTGEVIQIRSSASGLFNLHNIRSGYWKVELAMVDSSNSYELEESYIDLDLMPGEEKYLKLRVLPVKRALQMLD